MSEQSTEHAILRQKTTVAYLHLAASIGFGIAGQLLMKSAALHLVQGPQGLISVATFTDFFRRCIVCIQFLLKGSEMNIRRIALTMALSITVCANAADRYVSPTGSDTNPGTQAQPWQTIAKANNTLVAGDTVFLLPGTYTDQIRPVNNGTSETARIRYVAFGTGNVIIDNFGDQSSGTSYTVGGIALGGKSFVTVDGVNQYIRLNKAGCYNALGNITGANRVVINSVYFDGSNNTCNNMVFIAGYLYGNNVGATQYNVLSNSYLRGISATFVPRTEDVISVAGNAHHNLFHGNTIEYASHVGLNVGKDGLGVLPHNNMIRNNVFNNPLHTSLSFYQGGPNDNIAEGNRIVGGGGAPASPNGQNGTNGAGNGIQVSSARTIFRYNVIEKAGSTSHTARTISGFALSVGAEGSLVSVDNNRFYNNTLAKNSAVAVTVAHFTGAVTLNNTQNKFVNNILYDSVAPIDPTLKASVLYYVDTTDTTNDKFWSNIFGSPGGLSTDNVAYGDKWAGYRNISSAAGLSCTVYPCFVEQFTGKPNIYSATPGFVNYTAGDYNLNASSVAIDAGSALTKVATGDIGSGTTLKVEDPYFFQDGRGIPNVQADWIAVGTVSNVVQISSINYGTNTITLASSINRAVGNAIWLYKKSDGQQVLYGAGPDIGALEKLPTVVTPVANFACNPLNARLPSPNVVTCTDSSSNTPTVWSWTFGDGGTSTLQSPSRTYTTAGTYNVTLTASNGAGSNTLTRSAYVKVSQTLFTNQTPASPNATDGVPYELGMKFKSTKAGKILAIRYFKAATDTGTHVGKIWSGTGTLLASVTFTGETASGWQEQTLPTSLSILANTVYLVSVNIASHFPITTNAFPPSPSLPLTNGSLSVVNDGSNGRFGSPGAFPTSTFQNSNYFRDVLFLPN